MKRVVVAIFLAFSVLSFSQSSIVRKISVTGNSEREVSPDMAKISFTVRTKNENLSSATKEAANKVEKFKSDLNKNKIALSSFETLSLFSTKTRENDFVEISGEATKKENSLKKPDSYSINLTFSIWNTEFDKISSLMGNSEEMIQSVERDYETNSFYFSITETDKSIDSGLNKVIRKFEKKRRELISSGVAEENIRLNYHSISENFENNTSKEKDVYLVTHNFNVEIKDLKKLNELISIADDNSINIEGRIQFDISDKKKIESEMYGEAFNQAKSKATSILKSSKMSLSSPLVVSEDIAFQQKMIDRIDESWQVEASAVLEESVPSGYEFSRTASLATASKMRSRNIVDYTLKPIKLIQNISVMYEIK